MKISLGNFFKTVECLGLRSERFCRGGRGRGREGKGEGERARARGQGHVLMIGISMVSCVWH